MVGKVVPNVLVTVVQLLLLFTLGGPLFGLDVSGSWAALVVLILVLAVSLSAFGMLVTSLARTMTSSRCRQRRRYRLDQIVEAYRYVETGQKIATS